MLKRWLKYCTACVLLVPFSASATVNIAVIAPQEGDYKTFGNEIISGVKIAVDNINKEGGLNGEKINLITVDDRCDDRLAVSTAQMMALNTSQTDKISMVVGPYCSNAFQEVADIYAKAGIFQIIPTSISVQNDKSEHRGLVKLVGYRDGQSTGFYKYYEKNFANQDVAVVYDSNDRDIVEVAASLQREFKKHGNLDKLKAYSYASFENTDELAEAVIKDQKHIAYILGTPTQTAEISRRLKSEDENFVIFTNKYAAQEDYNEIMGDLAESIYYVGLPSLTDNPDFAETLVQLRLRGIEPQGLGIYGFSAVKLWEELVLKAGSFDYNKLSEALNSGKIETLWGETMFNNGKPENALTYGIYQKQNGQYTQVY